MSNKLSIPRGCSDIVFPEIYQWQTVENLMREILHVYNYQEIRTPIFEETELFARSMGQSSDVVMKQMLNLAAQPAEKNAELKLSGLSLRPENTASVVRSYILQNLDKLEGLSKLYYIGPMFRGERPQKGRLRQFHQVGVEAIGPFADSPYLDAEVIALSVDILKTLGLKNFTIKLNSLGSAEDKENFSNWLRRELKDRILELDEEDQSRFERNVFRVLDSKNKKTRAVIDSLAIESSALGAESRIYFDKVQKALKDMNIDFELDSKLVRGLDYYTHTVFEITSTSLGSQDALGAGGRYNNLVNQLGGPNVGAVGFALGIERILLALPQDQEVLSIHPDIYVIALDEKSFSRAWVITNILRQHSISCDICYNIASVKSLMRQANKSKAERVIIIGENELDRGVITIKNFQDGSQQEISIKNDNYTQLLELTTERL
ncbi:MAG: histidine--tRNA ligase [Candidatus Omnitrophota bacterium]